MKNITFLYLLVIAFLNAGISAMAQQPGGVPGSTVWLKADQFSGGATWANSGSGLDYTTVTGPTSVANAAEMNFNSAVEILSGGFDAPAGAELGAGGDWSVYTVATKLSSDLNGRLFDGHTGNNLWGYWAVYEDVLYLEAAPNVLTTSAADNNADLYSYVRNSSGALDFRSSGSSIGSYAGTHPASGVRIDINQGKATGERSHSRVAEMIVFSNTANSATDRQKIESYLALKYGLTLDNSVASYTNSLGTPVYTYTGGYENDVVGIAYDLAGGLDQRVSKSQNTGAILMLATDADFTSANDGGRTQLTDGQFLVMASNGGATATQTTEMDASKYINRLGREWRAENTGNVGAIHLKFNSFDDTYSLISDADGDFSSGATVVGALNASGEINATIEDGMYYTLGTIPSPGGVAGSDLWLKADVGVTGTTTVTQWNDHSGNGYNAVRNGADLVPSYVDGTNSNASNYNPTLLYTPAEEKLQLPTEFASELNGEFTVFTVAKDNHASGIRRFFGPYTGGTGGVSLELDVTPYMLVGTGNFSEAVNTAWTVGSSNAHIGVGERLATQWSSFVDGGIPVTSTTNLGNFTYNGNYAIGESTYNGASSLPFQGGLSEFIVYDAGLTTPERQKVESYLAIKYGITLDQTTTQNNYVASDGSKLWDKDTAASYKHDIFGIAKDLNSALNQQISKSINSDAFFILSTDTNFTNTNGTHTDTLENLEAVMLSNNNGSFSRQTTEICQCAGHERIGREWLMQVSGTTPDVNLAFDKADLTVSEDEEVYLLISTTGNFSNNLLSFHKMELNANDKYTTVLPTSTDNVYLTIGIVDKNKTRLRHGKRFVFQQLLKPVDNE